MAGPLDNCVQRVPKRRRNVSNSEAESFPFFFRRQSLTQFPSFPLPPDSDCSAHFSSVELSCARKLKEFESRMECQTMSTIIYQMLLSEIRECQDGGPLSSRMFEMNDVKRTRTRILFKNCTAISSAERKFGIVLHNCYPTRKNSNDPKTKRKKSLTLVVFPLDSDLSVILLLFFLKS